MSGQPPEPGPNGGPVTETVTKTLRFWVGDVGDEDFKLLHELSRTLARCHETFVWAALEHVRNDGKANNDCLREARRAYQERFGQSPFVKRFGNIYTGQIAFKDFKRQMGLIRTGQKSSVSFGPGSHANIDFITGATGTQAQLERNGEDWLMTGATLLKGEPKTARLARRWTLIPQTNRGRSAKPGQAARTMRQMDGALTRNMTRLVWRPKRGWEAQVVVTVPVVVSKAATEIVCGIDLGMRHLVVASIPDRRKQFWFGGANARELWRALDDDANRRRTLYKARKRSAARKQGEKVANKRRHLCELASRRLVDWMVREGVTTLRMEELTGIRERAQDDCDPRWNRRLSCWPWYYLQQRIEQKCAEVNIEVELVNPRNTSIMCSSCGHIDGANREGARFLCLRCGYERHADLNAANNVARGGEVDFDTPTNESGRAAVRLRGPKARPETGRSAQSSASATP